MSVVPVAHFLLLVNSFHPFGQTVTLYENHRLCNNSIENSQAQNGHRQPLISCFVSVMTWITFTLVACCAIATLPEIPGMPDLESDQVPELPGRVGSV